MQTTCSVEINATPDEVFFWLDDPERVMMWISGVVENQNLHETEDRIGTTFRQVVEENGKRMEIQGRITEYEPNRLLGIHLIAQGFEVDADYMLEEVAGRTRLTQVADVHFVGSMRFMALLIQPFLRKAATKKLQKDFAKLKELCESDTSA